MRAGFHFRQLVCLTCVHSLGRMPEMDAGRGHLGEFSLLAGVGQCGRSRPGQPRRTHRLTRAVFGFAMDFSNFPLPLSGVSAEQQ